MEITTNQILKVLYVLSWILFLGLCVEAGGIIFSAIYALFFNPSAANFIWMDADLSDLYNQDPGYFSVITFLMAIVAIMKTLIFYLIVKILHDKKLNMTRPFSSEVSRFVLMLAYLALGTGIFSFWTISHVEWLSGRSIKMPGIDSLNLGGADVWLFMAVVLFIIAQIFKRGVEIQDENDLTV